LIIKLKIKHIIISVFIFIAAIITLYFVFTKIKSEQCEISVIIPVYNVEQYLSECLDSVVNQTYKKIEIICINDGSIDSSLKILRDYQKKDSRIKLIDQVNKGVSSARNAGIRSAKGKYITFVDSDDYISLDTYMNCIQKLYETDADILVFDWFYFPTGNNERRIPEKNYINDSFTAIYNDEIANFSVNKIFKRSLIIDNEIFFNENVVYCEDDLFVLMTVPKAKNITLFSHKFYYYRQREGSASSMSLEKMAKSAIIRAESLIDDWQKQGYDQDKWLLDKVLSSGLAYIEPMNDAKLKSDYSLQLLDIIEKKLLNKIKKDEISESILNQLTNLRNYTK
jgi:glycosyltransferase involved in cell wall biosynthesis